MAHITILLITKNESENIGKLWGWVGECSKINQIVVVDDFSSDNTVNQIKKLKNKNLQIDVLKRRLNGDFSSQRQFALSKSINDWILWLDADECPSPELLNFIDQTLLTPGYVYSFPRQDSFLGQILKHGETANQRFTRLFHRQHGRFFGKVHEIWQNNQKESASNAAILHYPHPTIKSLLKRINFYTDIRSVELYQKNTKVNFIGIIAYPLAKFIQNYFLRLGFLDSTAGIIIAISMSLHSFLVRAKLWQLWSQSSQK